MLEVERMHACMGDQISHLRGCSLGIRRSRLVPIRAKASCFRGLVDVHAGLHLEPDTLSLGHTSHVVSSRRFSPARARATRCIAVYPRLHRRTPRCCRLSDRGRRRDRWSNWRRRDRWSNWRNAWCRLWLWRVARFALRDRWSNWRNAWFRLWLVHLFGI